MARKKRNEEEIEKIRKLLPKAPPPAALEEMKRRQKTQKLVYRCGYYREPITGLKKKAALVHCTACGEKYYLDYSVGGGGCHAGGYGDSFGFRDPLDHEAKITGDTCHCPECGAEAEALHISRFRGAFDIEKNYFMTVYNLGGHFVALSWLLIKQLDKEGRVFWDVKKYEGIAMIDGMPIRYTGFISGTYGCWLPEWTTRAVWRDNTDEWDADEIFMNRADFDASDASKSGLEEYIVDEQKKIRVGAYLRLWSKDPQIENLVRSGLSHILSQIIDKATKQSGYYYNYRRDFSVKEAEKFFNRKKVKPHEMLEIDKAEIPLVKEWDIDKLIFYKDMKTRGIRLSEEELADVVSVGGPEIVNLLEKAKQDFGVDITFIRALNYLKKQRNAHGAVVDAQYVLDYWRMTKAIQGTLPPELVFPKDIEKAHGDAVLRKKEKTNKVIDEKIIEYAKTLSWLSWEDEETGLFIRSVESQSELIKEGRFLSDCVGTYAAAVSRRETSILLIRRIEKPEIPFFTLEFNKGKVIQNRGMKNCARTPEVVIFEEKWLKHIESIKKGTKKNGKRTYTEQSAGKRAGA